MLVPGFELDSTKSFRALLTTSWAWSLLPPPPPASSQVALPRK